MFRSLDQPGAWIHGDVYTVIKAYAVTDAGIQHALKKLLCSGIRGKGSKLQDLKESIQAIERAIEQHLEDLEDGQEVQES